MQKIAINWENGNDKDEYDQKVNEKNYELKIISFERQQFVLKVDGVPMTNCQKKNHIWSSQVCGQMMITKEWEEYMFEKERKRNNLIVK